MTIIENEQIKVHDLVFQPFLSEEVLLKRTEEIGTAIAAQFADKNPLFISVLNGAFIFMADLMRACPIPSEVNFVRLSSYDGLSTTGNVNTVLGMSTNIEDRHVIIVEDIIDTGNTMKDFLKTINKLQPASVTLVTLLLKPDALQHPIPMDYIGFEIPNKFVVGYGLDYNEQGRNIRSIYQLAE